MDVGYVSLVDVGYVSLVLMSSSRTDGLVDTCVYKEVAMAKLTTKQNPPLAVEAFMYKREQPECAVLIPRHTKNKRKQ